MGGAASPNKFKNEKQYFEYFNEELKNILLKFSETPELKPVNQVGIIKGK